MPTPTSTPGRKRNGALRRSGRWSSLALALLLGGLTACASPLRQARDAYDIGDLTAAEPLAREAVDEDPGALEAHLLLIDILIAKERWQQAQDAAGTARMRHPDALVLWQREREIAVGLGMPQWFAFAWLNAVDRGDEASLADDELALALDGFVELYPDATLLEFEPEAPLALLAAASQHTPYAAWPDEARHRVNDVLNHRLYQANYQGEWDDAEALRSSYAEVLGERPFWWHKHVLLQDLERRRPADLDLFDDVDQLLAVAFEAESFGLYRAASALYLAAVEQVPDEQRPGTWVRVARVRYRAGDREGAREALSAVVAGATPQNVNDALQVAESGGDGGDTMILDAWLAQTTCHAHPPEAYAELAVERAHRIEDDAELLSVADAQLAACEQGCVEAACPAVAYLAFHHAEGFLDRGRQYPALGYAMRSLEALPTDEQTIALVLRLTTAIGDAQTADYAAGRYLDARREAGGLDSARQAAITLSPLDLARSPAIEPRYVDTLETLIERFPDDWGMHRRLAVVALEHDDLDRVWWVRDHFVTHADDPDWAMFQVLRWYSNVGEPVDAASELEAFATRVGPGEPYGELGGRGLAEASLRLAIDLRGASGELEQLRRDVIALAELLGEEDPVTWELLWGIPGIRADFDDDGLIWFSDLAIDAGFAPVDLWRRRAEALERLGRRAEALDAYIAMLELEPNRLERIVRDVDATWVVVALTDAYIARHGADVGVLTVRAEVLGEMAIDHRGLPSTDADYALAHSAYEACLDAGCYLMEQLDLIEELGFYDVAAEVYRARVESGTDGELVRRRWALARLGAGVPLDEVRDDLFSGLESVDVMGHLDIANDVAEFGYPGAAAELAAMALGAARLEDRGMEGIEVLFTLEAAATFFVAAGDRERALRFIDEAIIYRADLLRVLGGPLPEGMRPSDDRVQMAGRFYNLASRYYEALGAHAEAAEAAHAGLEVDTHDDARMLARALRAEVRLAHPDPPDRAALERAIGAAGGQQDAWYLAAQVLRDMGQLGLADELYGEAADREGVLLPEIQAEHVALLGRLGQWDRAEALVASAGGRGGALWRELLLAARLADDRARWARYGAEALAAGAGESALDLAELALAGGDVPTALRHLSHADVSDQDAVIALYTTGAQELAWRELQARAPRDPETIDRFEALTPYLIATRGIRAWDRLAEDYAQYAEHLADWDQYRAWMLASHGDIAGARARLAAIPEEWVTTEVAFDRFALAASQDDPLQRALALEALLEAGALQPMMGILQVLLATTTPEEALAVLAEIVDDERPASPIAETVRAYIALLEGDLARVLDVASAQLEALERPDASLWTTLTATETLHRLMLALDGWGYTREAYALSLSRLNSARRIEPLSLLAPELAAREGWDAELTEVLAILDGEAGSYGPARLAIAEALARGGAFDEARSRLEALASGGGPTANDAYAALAQTGLRAGDAPDWVQPPHGGTEAWRERALSLAYTYALDPASEALEEAVAELPNEVNAATLLTVAFLRGDTVRVASIYASLPLLHNDVGVAALSGAQELSGGPDLALDEALWRQAARYYPVRATVQDQLAVARLRAGDPAGLDALITQASASTPERWARQIDLLWSLGESEAAMTLWEAAPSGTRLDPAWVSAVVAAGLVPSPEALGSPELDPEVFAAVATAYLEVDDAASATRYLAPIAPIFSEGPMVRGLEARLAARAGDPAALEAAVDALIEAGPDTATLAQVWVDVARAEVPALADRLATAIAGRAELRWQHAWLEQAPFEGPSTLLHAASDAGLPAPSLEGRWPELMQESSALSIWYEATGSLERSTQLEERALAFATTDWQREYVANNLAYHYAENGVSLDRAERLARESLVGSAIREDWDHNTLDTLAWVHFQQGRYALAAEELRVALRLLAVDDGRSTVESRRVLTEHLEAALEGAR